MRLRILAGLQRMPDILDLVRNGTPIYFTDGLLQRGLELNHLQISYSIWEHHELKNLTISNFTVIRGTVLLCAWALKVKLTDWLTRLLSMHERQHFE